MPLRSTLIGILLAAVTWPASPQAATGVRYSNTTPPAPSGSANITWQHDASTPIQNISAYVAAPSNFDAAGAAATAQSNAQTYAANASNLSSGTISATLLPAATTSAQGAVVLPAGASGNTLGSAAIAAASAFDAAGAAATAQSNAQTYAANASHLSSGTISATLLPAVPSNSLTACATAATITAPCTVYQSGIVNTSSLTNYATVFTTSVQGVYVLNCNIYATTASSTAFVINLDFTAHLLNATANTTGVCASSTIGVTAVPQLTNVTFNGIFAASLAILIGTYASSGSNTGGAWNYVVTIERLQ
jgi:hypothetical protein